MTQFKYLPEDWPTPTVYCPNIGDFVVLTVDPVASVAHLDREAIRAARKLPRNRFVALVMTVYGLPLTTKPVTHCLIALVRQGPPTLYNPPWDSPDMCYPIFPNTYHPTRSETIQPTHPFPLNNCYIDMTSAFLDPIRCRVTTTPRDYTPVLAIPTSQLSRLRALFSDEVTYMEDLEEKLRLGDLEVIASIPLPSTPISPFEVPLPPSPSPNILGRKGSSVRTDADTDESGSAISLPDPAIRQAAPDEVSMIASDDSASVASDDEGLEELWSEAADDQLFEMMRFENMMNATGDPRDPVVDVSYDLDEVDKVTDPLLFIKIRDQLRGIIDDAELRLGIRIQPPPAERPPTLQSATSSAKNEQPTSLASTPRSPVRPKSGALLRGLFGKLRDRGGRLSLAFWHRLRNLAIAPCHSPSATTDADV